MRIAVILALAALPGLAQEFKWPASFEKLTAKAKESVDLNLDGALLQMAGGYLSQEKPDEAKVKRLITGIKGIFVKSFEFDREGEYNPADLEVVRSQAKGPGWQRLIQVKETRESFDLYMKIENGKPAGMLLVAAEPKELTVVYINGAVDLASLSDLGGKFGIPDIDLPDQVPHKSPRKN